jgi:D-tyrosyl-tRNA(Tyr) deacylase
MKLVIQRAIKGKVLVGNDVIGAIGNGMVVLVGFGKEDDKKVVSRIIQKLLNLRIMEDGKKKMNKSILETKGELLLVPQFTLYANTKKGNRPSFTDALEPEKASELFSLFADKLKMSGLKVETGEFGSQMNVNLTNHGPVTIILEEYA